MSTSSLHCRVSSLNRHMVLIVCQPFLIHMVSWHLAATQQRWSRFIKHSRIAMEFIIFTIIQCEDRRISLLQVKACTAATRSKPTTLRTTSTVCKVVSLPLQLRLARQRTAAEPTPPSTWTAMDRAQEFRQLKRLRSTVPEAHMRVLELRRPAMGSLEDAEGVLNSCLERTGVTSSAAAELSPSPGPPPRAATMPGRLVSGAVERSCRRHRRHHLRLQTSRRRLRFRNLRRQPRAETTKA